MRAAAAPRFPPTWGWGARGREKGVLMSSELPKGLSELACGKEESQRFTEKLLAVGTLACAYLSSLQPWPSPSPWPLGL